MITFYLGIPEPAWLPRVDVPTFVSHTRLARRKRLPRARAPWALDSGGFTQLKQYGTWTVTALEYAAAVRRYDQEIGLLDWAAPQDWMCEPDQLARTGLDVWQHQRLTVDNFLELRELEPDLPWAPVLQGWTPGQYLRHRDMYAAAGVDLTQLPRVGVGSVCRRPNPLTVVRILDLLAMDGLTRLHGFGVKTSVLPMVADQLASADSQAWSYAARVEDEPCPEGKRDCRNCLHWALDWADEVRGRFESRAA